MLQRPIPVTVVTGFLGAGKTTLVNCLLADHRPLNIAVVVNEYGEVGIDGELIEAEPDAVIEIRNGCVCCTVRTDLVGSVLRLLERPGPPIERLIVETSGLADPAPVLQSFLADGSLRERVRLESVVTLVDAVHAAATWHDDIAREQLAFADVLVLSKADLVTPAALAELHRQLAVLNPTAPVIRAAHGRTTEPLLGINRFSLADVLAIEPALLDDAPHDHEHDSSIVALSFTQAGALDAPRFERWINRLAQTRGADLLRMKGILSLAGEARRYHFHGVHMLLETTPGRRWAAHEQRETRLVMIGRGLDATSIAEQLQACRVLAEAGSPA
jgi:G3E family GTPase